MRSFTAHVRAGRAPVLVPEAFSFWALLLPLPWLLWKRLWIPAAIWFALALAGAVVGLLHPAAGIAASAALALGAGAFGHDLHRFVLGLRGYAQEAVVVAPDQDAALARLATLRPEVIARAYAAAT